MHINKCWYKKVCTQHCSTSCPRYLCMRSLCTQARIPERQWNIGELTCGKVDKKAFDDLDLIKRHINNFVEKGSNLLITSPICGNGKTSWAIKILLSYFDKNWHNLGFNCGGLFINVPQLLFQSKANISNPKEEFEELQTLLKEVDIVVWDDVASGALTEYEYQILLNYIDARTVAGKSNIFTSNCTEQDARQILGNRLFSRVWDTSIIIKLNELGKRGRV